MHHVLREAAIVTGDVPIGLHGLYSQRRRRDSMATRYAGVPRRTVLLRTLLVRAVHYTSVLLGSAPWNQLLRSRGLEAAGRSPLPRGAAM